MTPGESTQLTTLTNEVKGLRADLRVFHTKLFGDDDGETAQGRIPRLEAKVAAHERKLARWEPIHFALRGVWLLLVGAAGYFADHFLPFKGH